MRISFVTGVLCTNFQMAKESASIEPTIKKQKVPVPLGPSATPQILDAARVDEMYRLGNYE